MKLLSTFEAVYLVGTIPASFIRVVYTRRFSQNDPEVPVPHPRDRLWMSLSTLGIIIPLCYLAFPWIDFADYPLLPWTGWLGTLLFSAALLLLWRSYTDLGKSWSPWAEPRKDNTLITTGIYNRIRHPMYAAQWLWAVAQMFLLQNWIAGPAMIVTLLPLYLYRVEKEEQLMLERNGQKYRDYINRTCRLLPCPFNNPGTLR